MAAEISLIDLVNALEATSHGLEWQVDLATGDVLERDEETGPRRAAGRFRALPTSCALCETEIRREFCALMSDEIVQEKLAGSVESRAFFDHLRCENVMDDWLVHRRSRLADLALEWAAAEDVVCRRDLSAASLSSN